MSHEFFQTPMGRKFYERDIPECIRALTKIAESLKEINETIEDTNRILENIQDERYNIRRADQTPRT